MVDNDFLAKLVKQIEDSNKRAIEEANKTQTFDIKDHINKEIIQLTKKFEDKLKRNNEKYETKYMDLKIKYEKLEKESRKNNVIIFGLDNQDKDLANYVIDALNDILEINLTIQDIDNIYKIGKQTEKKPIKIKFVSYLKKQEIQKNCRKLKGTNISVAEDLSLEERKENQILRQHLKRARAKQLNASIKNKKLLVNGQAYTAQELAAQEIHGEEEETTLDNETVLEIYEKSNSAPPTPTTSKQEEIIKENKQEDSENVFEIGNVSVFKERKKNIVNEAVSKLRSSVRLNSTENKKEASIAEFKTPKKTLK